MQHNRYGEQNKRLLCFYGDDFTGSTDAMEALAMNGVKTVLFLEPPSQEMLDVQFPDIQAFGVAGVGRSLTPQQMEDQLPPIFEALSAISAPIMHYKICSTFDSAPEVGSIGKAIEIARRYMASSACVPLLVGAPALKRYTIFGHHFAAVGDRTYRLDRHPVMSHHPVTPMNEADLLLHLSKQTSEKSALIDIRDLALPVDEIEARVDALVRDGARIVLFDVLDDERLEKVGALLWNKAQQAPLLVFGSSGVEYALAAHLQSIGRIDRNPVFRESPGPVHPMLAISGSCSSITQQQIEYALAHGFTGIRADAGALMDFATSDSARKRLYDEASALLQANKSVIIYTALGAFDESIATVKAGLAARGISDTETGRLLGRQLGMLCKDLVADLKLKRILIAGGDTSGYVTQALGIYGLEAIAPIAPGGPLCRGYSEDARFNGIEISLKGGQVGSKEYIVQVLQGRISDSHIPIN